MAECVRITAGLASCPTTATEGFFQVEDCLPDFAVRSLSNRSTSFSTRLRMN